MNRSARRWSAVVLVAATALLLGAAAERSGLSEELEQAAWDHRVRLFATPAPDERILLVLFDERSLQSFASSGDECRPRWPIRGVTARIITKLHEAGARAIVVDQLYEDIRCNDFIADEMLAVALSEAPTSVAVMPGREPSTVANFATLRGHVGAVEEGSRRRVRAFDGEPLLGFTAPLLSGDRLEEDLPSGDLWLRYRSPRTNDLLYPHLSAAAVLERSEDLADDVSGRYVLLGVAAPGLFDVHPSPVKAAMLGVEVHATALDNLLEDDFLRPVDSFTQHSLILFSAVFGAAATVRAKSISGVAAACAAVAATPWIVGYVAYALGFQWRVAEAALIALAAVGGGALAHLGFEGRRRRFLRRAFDRYLSPAVIERLIEDPARLALGGERRELTIFFSDVAGFSSIAERLDPVELTALLNDYLGEMTEIILDVDGTLDKYEGDAIIAFWNAPVDQSDHARRAVDAALACSRRLAELRPRYRDVWDADLTMRIGVHTGEVVVGNLGSARRFDYTVLGDAANLASRLEGANKIFGTEIMISESTWRLLGESAAGRRLGSLVVVGRSAPIDVYEPRDPADGPEPSDWEEYRRAQEAFRCGDREAARRLFARLRDSVSSAYAEELQRDDWDGVWRPTTK